MSKNAEQKAAHEAAYAIVGELVIGATMLDHPQIAWAKLEALVQAPSWPAENCGVRRSRGTPNFVKLVHFETQEWALSNRRRPARFALMTVS
jgi:hypothetical protein